jgi:coenzyme Q-binding protein COQ10
MGHYTYDAVYPVSAERLFDMVADIERYPEFLPLWAAARIRRRDGDVLFVDQVIRRSYLRWRFASTAELDRPRRLRIESTSAPFRHLEIIWRFEEPTEAACLVKLEASYSFRSRATRKLAEQLMDSAVRQYVRAFEQRSRDLTA